MKPRALGLVPFLVALLLSASSKAGARELTFEDRIQAQEAIERVYYAHQIGVTKPFEEAVSREVLERKVRTYLERSADLERIWNVPVTSEMLYREAERMARASRMPDRLRELHTALGDDDFLIQECLARPILVDRLLREDSLASPSAREAHSAVWTGSLMIVWGGSSPEGYLNSGGRYDPATDSWTATSTVDAPNERAWHSAVWTGSQMVVWGGFSPVDGYVNTGGRYDPVSDSWNPTSMVDAPQGRFQHTAVWSGTRMVVWGGRFDIEVLRTGGGYDPATDTWTDTSTAGAPTARFFHTAVWTGNVMVVWGGRPGLSGAKSTNTGGRYDPMTDSWTPTSTVGAPERRERHAAVSTGSEMIVWGGTREDERLFYRTGRRYDPVTDSWTPTARTGAPKGRSNLTAVWSGSEMIVWGGINEFNALSTGGRYDPATDAWRRTSIEDAPVGRWSHTAVWAGSLMVIWGGFDNQVNYLDSGGRYEPATDEWTPTSMSLEP